MDERDGPARWTSAVEQRGGAAADGPAWLSTGALQLTAAAAGDLR
ncbi:hypothetical protein QFZ66_003035 [Streptomyces sp. B4I13]|nr:hypothetical protein [Streptomyces sp. B4I13]MDQ0959157.1 hypothetical protein [Streptomyces sp. B4I13]